MTAYHIQLISLKIRISLRLLNRGVSTTEVTQGQMRRDDDHEVHIP
jgi:hypothetical protein